MFRCLSVALAFWAAVGVPFPFGKTSRWRGPEAMVLGIAMRHFPRGGLVVVSDDVVGAYTATRGILEAGVWPVISMSSSYRAPRRLWLVRHRAACFVLIGDRRRIRSVLDGLRNNEQTWWNSSALFLLVLQRSDDVAEMHRWMLGIQVTNVVMALLPEDEPPDAVPLVSVLPPRQAVCWRRLVEPTRTDTWLPDNDTFLDDQDQLFVPRGQVQEDCRRCGLRVARAAPPAMYVAEGRVYEELFLAIFRHLGCDLRIRDLPPGFDDLVPLNESERLPGAYDDVIRGRADVVLRYGSMTENRSAILSPSTSLDLHSIQVYVGEKYVGVGFPTALELTVVLMLAVAMVVNHLQLAFRRRYGLPHIAGVKYCDVVPSMLSAWSLFAEQSPARKGRASRWDRLLWLSLAFGAVSVNTVRRSVYATNAMRPRFVHVTSVDQLVADGVPVGAHDETIYNVFTEEQESGLERLPAIVDCFTDPARCLGDLVRSEGRFALLLNAATFYVNLTAGQRSRLRMLSPPFYLFPVTTYFSKDHPLVEAFSTRVLRLQNAGIIRYKFGRFLASAAPRASANIAAAPKRLKLRDIAPCFNVLMIGFPVALACFLVELVAFLWRPKLVSLKTFFSRRTLVTT